jgi:signal transduction histidine kinase
VHPDHREQTDAFYREQFRKRATAHYFELPAMTKDGRTVWVGQHVNVFVENNRIMYHQGVCRDITERVMAQTALRESNDRLRRLAARQEEMLEEERSKLAHDLHDGIGQSINLARIKLSDLMLHGETGVFAGAISEVVDIVDDARSVIRTLEFDLSPPVLRELGLEPALQWLAEQMHADYGLQVSLSDDEETKPLGQASRAVVFRAVRELLINVARHAGTRRAHVDTQREGAQLVVTVSDEGSGFDFARISKGLGLTGIQERFAHLGGSVVINSAPAEGTVITLSLPLEHIKRGVGE